MPPLGRWQYVVWIWRTGALGMVCVAVNTLVLVKRVSKDGLAAAAGVEEGAFILGVNGQPVVDCAYDDVIDRIAAASRPLSLRLLRLHPLSIGDAVRGAAGPAVAQHQLMHHASADGAGLLVWAGSGP